MLESDAASEDGGPGESAIKVTHCDDGGIVIDNPLGNWSFVASPMSSRCNPTNFCYAFLELNDRNRVPVDYNSIFSVGSPVYRSVQLLNSASHGFDGTFGYEKEELTVTIVDSHSTKQTSGRDSTSSTCKEPRLKNFVGKTSLRSYPALPLTNHVFEILLEPEVAIARITAWLDSMSLMSYEYCSTEVAWNCSHRDFCSQLSFDVNMYKLPIMGNQQGKYMIELLRRGGDRLRIIHLYNELKFLFADESREYIDNDESVELPTNFSGSTGMLLESDPSYISEERIKNTLLSVLRDSSCDYSTKAEAIRLAGCIFTSYDGNGPIVSSIDRDIVEAVASLRHSNVLFDWVAIPAALAAIECH